MMILPLLLLLLLLLSHLDVVPKVFGEPRVLLFEVVLQQQPSTLPHL
jgi:hypothetical protein